MALGSELRSVIVAAQSRVTTVPGPEVWAMHAARAWIEPDAERDRLRDSRLRTRVDVSRRRVRQLGPAWRAEEIAHVSERVFGSPLPGFRVVTVDGSMTSLYELTHVAMYSTDFGAVRISNPPSDVSTVAVASLTNLGHNGWDLIVELILASRFVSGAWPPAADRWIGMVLPSLVAGALSNLRRDPERYFLPLYHPLIWTALLLAGAERSED